MENWGWHVSVRFYELFYSNLMHEIDGYTLGFLEDRVKGARILDVGAGTGNIDFKLVSAGAREIFAIEQNSSMRNRINSKKLRKPEYDQGIITVNADMYGGVISKLGNEEKFDIELFRRSLYAREDKVIGLLKEGYQNLKKGGTIFIVHPEADKGKYLDDGFGGFAFTHWLKWHISNIGARKALEYNRYGAYELFDICKEACPDATITLSASIRPAYNIAVIEKPSLYLG